MTTSSEPQLQPATPERQAQIEHFAAPIAAYLMSLRPPDALHTLVAVTSLMLLAFKHKEGKGPLDTLNDHFVPAVKKTVEMGLKEPQP